jgi:AcrR family transcriptional regulator
VQDAWEGVEVDPDAPSDGPRGLRERKKLATRRALRRAALELALAKGPAAVTVEAIAEAAGVAPRTFFNYFSAKEEALVGPGEPLAAALAAEVRSRPVEEPALWAIGEVIAGRLEGLRSRPEQLALWRAQARLVREHPGTLLPWQLAAFAALEETLATAVAERLPVGWGGAEARALGRLAAGTAMGAARVVLDEVLDDAVGDPGDLGASYRRVLASLPALVGGAQGSGAPRVRGGHRQTARGRGVRGARTRTKER